MKTRFLSSISIFLTLLTLTCLWLYWSETIKVMSDWQTAFHQLLSSHIRDFKTDPTTNGLILIAASFGYGVFHAAGPGHGKAVLVTYLSTQDETLKQGIFISFAAAVFQALVAVGIVSVISILLNQTFSQANLISMRTEQISYILVVLFGAYLLFQSASKLKHLLLKSQTPQEAQHPHHDHSNHDHSHHDHSHHDHSHHDHSHHDHSHHDHSNCCHTYTPVEKISTLQTLGVILSMGARPCTGAIMVLIYSKIVGIYWVGVAATLLMGVGTGITVATLGFMTVFFREKLKKLVTDNGHSHQLTFSNVLLSSAGGVILMSLGWGLFQASIAPAAAHPLF